VKSRSMLDYIKRFFKFLLTYIGFTVFLFCFVLLIISFFKDKPAPPNSILTIRVDAPLEEKESSGFFAFQHDISLQKLRHVLNSALHNPNIKGVIIEADTPYIGGYAQIEELRRMIQKFKDAQKSVYFYTRQFGEGTNATGLYYLASACSGIYLQPGGILSFMGMNWQKLFMKDFLDKIGVKFDVFKQKEFKGAADPRLYNDFSPPVKQNLSQIIKENMSEIKQNIAEDRGKTVKDIEKLLQNAPLMEQEAYNQGYVTGVLYHDEFYDLFKKYNLVKYQKYFAKDKKKKYTKKVAVVYYDGIFNKYRKGQEFVKGSFNERQFEKQIHTIIEQKYDGILIRVNSPGGSATAAEAMYGVLLRAKQKGLKIVISMGDVSASAGYLISCAADKIVAEPLTITGSIGTIFARPNVKGALDKLGLTASSIDEGANLSLFSFTQDLTSKQRDKLIEWSRYSYEDFITKVAKARGKTLEEVDAIAKGQVWTGRKALELGLIDALGGMETAHEQIHHLLETDKVEFIDMEDSAGGLWEQIIGEAQVCMAQGVQNSLWSVVRESVGQSIALSH